MPDEPRDRAARQATNLARHLNDSYSDTALFLARHAARRDDARSARFVAVEADQVVLSLEPDNGAGTLVLNLPGAPGDVRARLRQLVLETRALLGHADVPVTSLETMLADKPGSSR